jgi:hypothetical protein
MGRRVTVMLLELAQEERFIARKASDGEPYFVAALLRMRFSG